MLKSTISLMALFMSLQAFAIEINSEEKVCKDLLAKAEQSCDEAMCEEFGDDCERDGDFYEGFQICVYDGELPDLIKEYNKKHPRTKVTCEDI